MRYDQAKDKCLAMGSHVVEFGNEAELVEVRSPISNLRNLIVIQLQINGLITSDKKPFWIGLIDKKNDGNFTWEDSGRSLSYDVSVFWGTNQPANQMAQDMRVCTKLNKAGKMDDTNCNANGYVVCQKNSNDSCPSSRRKRGTDTQQADEGICIVSKTVWTSDNVDEFE